MSEIKNEIVSRKAFDLQEAVVLLDVYLSIRRKGVANAEAAEIASQRLRSLARKRGMAIDDAFRSAMGLQNRLRSIGCLFEGTESASAPGTQVFREAVDLYRTDRQQYKRLLADADVKSRPAGRDKRAFPESGEPEAQKQPGNSVSIEKAEAYLAAAGLQGAAVQDLINNVQPGAAAYATQNALEASRNVIAMPGNRYVHAEAFVDLDEAEETMGRILQTHFAQFGGYSNHRLLFGAASHDLSMFLNDNDCEDIDSVYALAQYFFGKKAEKQYKFSYPHIFENTPDFPPSLKGLMINLARMSGGVLDADDAKDYLQKTMLSYGSIGQLLQIASSDTFLMYDSSRYLLSEKMGIDGEWKRMLHDRLDDLFRQADVAYVIPRDIRGSWFAGLPALPQGLGWTVLLLQEVLRQFPDIGFRPVTSELGQARDTIAAAFVPAASPLQSFPDVVTLFMQERHALPKRMACEQLRQELREAGMLEGGELIYALPKALNDYRFSWTDENKTVLVRGN